MAKSRCRNRRLRRTRRQVQRHGKAAKRRHTRPHGRTGQIHAKQTPSRKPAGLHSSAGAPASSALLFAVAAPWRARAMWEVRRSGGPEVRRSGGPGLDADGRRLHHVLVTSSH